MRLIDADSLVKNMTNECNRSQFGRSAAKYCVKKEPTIDAQPIVHAKWNLADDGDGIVCSNCEEDFCTMIYEEERMLYCPNCGAKMDRKED